jgi:hypothetical protein
LKRKAFTEVHRTHMITKGNTKLGAIHNFSIPAIKTCPGRSEFCESLCYACRFRYMASNVQKAHHRNWEMSKDFDWVDNMLAEIRKMKVKILRIHAAGDFYDVSYIKKWHKIVKSSPETKFYAYTRSWNTLDLTPHLVKMSQELNFDMWWSWDRDMPDPPEVDGIRVCYLMENDEDLPPREVDLVFRNSPSSVSKYTLMKQANGSLVCPYEQGVVNKDGEKPKMSCKSCSICFNTAKVVTLDKELVCA